MAGGFAATLTMACGSVVLEPSTSNSVGSGGTTGSGGSTASSGNGGNGVTSGDGGAIGFGGYGSSGETVGGGGSPSMPGMFDCHGCLCDGATHYCDLGSAGPPSPPGPPPEPMCAEDGGAVDCLPIPAECLPAPTCACIKPEQSFCKCDVLSGGITVTCNYP